MPSLSSLSTERNPSDDWQLLGAVGKAHGLKGFFFLSGAKPFTPEELHAVKVGSALASAESVDFTATLQGEERVLLRLSHAPDRTAVEKIRGQNVYGILVFSGVKALLGKDVQSESGEVLGQVKDTFNFGASDVLVVENAQGALLDIPYVSDYFADMPSLQLKVPASTFSDLWY